jgi:hypothetical protein
MLRVVAADRESGRPIYGFTRRGLLLFAIPLGGVTTALVIGVLALARERHDTSVNCRALTSIAAIDAEAQRQMQARTRAFLPRLNFPGLTHAELEHLSHEGEAEESMRVGQLAVLARRTCESF